MRKKLLLVAVATLCLLTAILTAGCGKSELVVAVEAQIAALGDITLDSDAAITEAEEAYALLQEKEQKQVENYDVLTAARTTYEELVAAEIKAQNDALVAVVDDAIAAIGEVTVDSGEAITAAQAAYAALPAELQPQVADYAAIDAAAAQLIVVKAAAVDALIAAIGEVTLESGDAIDAANAAYTALTQEEQTAVTGVATLTAATDTYTLLREEAKAAALKALLPQYDVSEDRVQGITWYMPKAMPNYIDVRSYVIPYIGVNSSYSWICTRYNYTGDSWIFWEKMTIVIDGAKYVESVSRNNITRDNDTEVWEYYDKVADDEELERLAAIANSTETIIRFEGDNYYYDLTVTSKDKEAIKNVLALYDALS